ncbi:hypothetical protein CTAYLR_002384 [Chrysophaeum taylorii]|uniref:Uncharacterized protein n=1 Tax=Chrysophaeum taylorii TaxID=2483200 RepID=A0AAD7UGF2_9STRA|nr:hypothetical protein CTAYLR_002384 [Chrysophaeum taylorii]
MINLVLVGAVVVASSETQEEPQERRRLSSDDYHGSKQSIGEIEAWRLGLAMALVLGLGSLAAGAGIGGGGLFVPIYWLILDAGAKGAVPLSKATILGGAIGNFVTIGWAKHPKADRPLIDYEAATFMQSGELLGVVFGVLANLVLPEVCIIVFLAVILSYNARRTIRKGFRTRAKENQALMEASKVLEEETKDDVVVRAASPPGGELEMVALFDAEEQPNKKSEIAALADKVRADDARQFPLWAWAQLVPMTAFLFVYGLLKREVFTPCATWNAGKHDPLREREGEPHGYAGGVYWLWYWTPIPVYAGFMILTAHILKARTKRREALGDAYAPLPADLKWDDGMLARFPKVALLAGIAAGLLGIGGGMIIGPLFLEIGIEPQVGTSTCAFMILFTATSGVFLYLFSGNVGWQLALWCVVFGFASGQAGQRGVNYLLKKTGRPSYVIFLLGAIVASACVAMTISGAVTVAIDASNGKDVFELTLTEFKCVKGDH